jgi:predicted nucleotidyltransferase
MVFIPQEIQPQVLAAAWVAHRLFPDHVQAAYLVGSWAAGNVKPTSDIDVVITTHDLCQAWPDREAVDGLIMAGLEAMGVRASLLPPYEQPGEVHVSSFDHQLWAHPHLAAKTEVERDIVLDMKKAAIPIVDFAQPNILTALVW